VAVGRVRSSYLSNEGAIGAHPPRLKITLTTHRQAPKWFRGADAAPIEMTIFFFLHRDRLRAIEAQRIQANEPCRSIHLQTRQVWRYRYLIFGEEGFIDPRDSVEEFPSCGW
jgi:hypothetical protein